MKSSPTLTALNISGPVAVADAMVKESPRCTLSHSLLSNVADDESSTIIFVRSRRTVSHTLTVDGQFAFRGQSQLPISLLKAVPGAQRLGLGTPLSQWKKPLQSLGLDTRTPLLCRQISSR